MLLLVYSVKCSIVSSTFMPAESDGQTLPSFLMLHANRGSSHTKKPQRNICDIYKKMSGASTRLEDVVLVTNFMQKNIDRTVCIWYS